MHRNQSEITMEKQFDINTVMQYYDLDPDVIAQVLFPSVKYPKIAFGRVLKGEANLDTVQLELLAKHLGVFVHDLFFVTSDWKGSSEDGCLVFLKGDFKVKLNYKGVFLSLYHGEELIYQELNLHNMTVPVFVEYISLLIKKYKENGNC